jgi:hypothetical protein
MTRIETLGQHGQVAVEIAGWDGVGASVDLSCACMFTHEAQGAPLAGGLAHLDQALGGGLLALRRDGLFRADRGESLFIATPPAGVRARALLVVGLGTPEDWSPAVMEAAVRQVVGAAFFRPFRSIAFAASMLDGGLTPARTAGAGAAMLRGLIAGLDAAARLQAMNWLEPLALQRWVFDVGAARFDAAARQFRSDLATLTHS